MNERIHGADHSRVQINVSYFRTSAVHDRRGGRPD